MHIFLAYVIFITYLCGIKIKDMLKQWYNKYKEKKKKEKEHLEKMREN